MLTIEDVANRITRRAAGDFAASADMWADEIVYWRNGSTFKLLVAGRQWDARLRSEIEVLRRAMPDFQATSIIHVDEQANVIIELATWQGHTIRIPGSAVEGEHHRMTQCFIYTVEGGRVTQLDVYDDASRARRWSELMTHTRLLDLVR